MALNIETENEDTPLKNEEKETDSATKKLELNEEYILRDKILFIVIGLAQVSMIIVTLFIVFGPTLYKPNVEYPFRPFNTHLYWWMNQHRNSKGSYYGHIVATHGTTGYFTTLTVIPGLFLTIKGSSRHILFGYLSISCLTLFLFMALTTEAIYSSNRGFLQCQFVYHSFNLFITLQFIPWYMWICELILYGHTSTVYRTGINGDKYVSRSKKYFMIYLSVVSIIYCLLRWVALAAILIDPKSRKCSRVADTILFAMANFTDSFGIWWSVMNIKFIQKSIKGEVNDNDWKTIHGRSFTVLWILMCFAFIGLIVYKFLDADKGELLYLALIYVVLVPLLIFLLRKWKKDRESLDQLKASVY